jgi:hypothetical protein
MAETVTVGYGGVKVMVGERVKVMEGVTEGVRVKVEVKVDVG